MNDRLRYVSSLSVRYAKWQHLKVFSFICGFKTAHFRLVI